MQNFALIDDYTVIQNVMTPLYFQPHRKDRRALAEKALERVGIAGLKNKRVSEISGGEKQRCAIARAIVSDSSVILADEPTGQLDTANAREILSVFSSLNREGVTVIVVTHDEKVAAVCGRRILLTDGKVVSDTATGL